MAALAVALAEAALAVALHASGRGQNHSSLNVKTTFDILTFDARKYLGSTGALAAGRGGPPARYKDARTAVNLQLKQR